MVSDTCTHSFCGDNVHDARFCPSSKINTPNSNIYLVCITVYCIITQNIVSGAVFRGPVPWSNMYIAERDFIGVFNILAIYSTIFVWGGSPCI